MDRWLLHGIRNAEKWITLWRVTNGLSNVIIYPLTLIAVVFSLVHLVLLHLHLDLLVDLLLHPHVRNHLLVLQVLRLTHLRTYEVTHLVKYLRSVSRITAWRVWTRGIRRRGMFRLIGLVFILTGRTRLLLLRGNIRIADILVVIELIYESKQLRLIVTSSRAHTDIVGNILVVKSITVSTQVVWNPALDRKLGTSPRVISFPLLEGCLLKLFEFGFVLLYKGRGFDICVGLPVHKCIFILFNDENWQLVLVFIVFRILLGILNTRDLVLGFLDDISLFSLSFDRFVNFALKNLIVQLGVVNLLFRFLGFFIVHVDALLEFLEELLGVRSAMSRISSTYVLFHQVPVFTVDSESLQEHSMLFVRPSSEIVLTVGLFLDVLTVLLALLFLGLNYFLSSIQFLLRNIIIHFLFLIFLELLL